MGFEKVVLIGVIAVVLIIVMQGFRTVNQVQKMAKKQSTRRKRRKISSEPAALEIADGLLGDIAKKYPDLCKEAVSSGRLSKKLQKEVDRALEHYLDRVNHKFKGHFHLKTSEILLEQTEKSHADVE